MDGLLGGHDGGSKVALARRAETPHVFPEMAVPVEIYTTDYCAYCFVAERLRNKRKIPYVEIDVSGNAKKRRWLAETTGRRTVPQIFIGGVSIGGSDELHALDKSGKLAEMLSLA